MSTTKTPRARLLAALIFSVLLAASAQAQCPGDCNGDGEVRINELIQGVNIALGQAMVSQCPAFDVNGDGMVRINELIAGVNAALGGCPDIMPTPTATPSGDCGNEIVEDGEECDDGMQCTSGENVGDPCTEDADCSSETVAGTCALRSGDGCQEDCLLPVCGDGFTDNQPASCLANVCVGANSSAGESCTDDADCGAETCDDGNNDEGANDACPANCRIAACVPGGDTVTVDVAFSSNPAGAIVTGMELFLRYPDGVVSIPGSSNAPSVMARIVSPGGIFPSITPNDRDYGLVLVLLDPSLFGADAGTVVTVEFDTCQGAAAPSAADFTCAVNSASDENLADITDLISCQVQL